LIWAADRVERLSKRLNEDRNDGGRHAGRDHRDAPIVNGDDQR